MTISGLKLLKRATSSSTLSASTCAVRMLGLPIAFTIASHLDFVRLAIIISVNTSGFWATLCATTVPTPPAPIIRTLPISFNNKLRVTNYKLKDGIFPSPFHDKKYVSLIREPLFLWWANIGFNSQINIKIPLNTFQKKLLFLNKLLVFGLFCIYLPRKINLNNE